MTRTGLKHKIPDSAVQNLFDQSCILQFCILFKPVFDLWRLYADQFYLKDQRGITGDNAWYTTAAIP